MGAQTDDSPAQVRDTSEVAYSSSTSLTVPVMDVMYRMYTNPR